MCWRCLQDEIRRKRANAKWGTDETDAQAEARGRNATDDWDDDTGDRVGGSMASRRTAVGCLDIVARNDVRGLAR